MPFHLDLPWEQRLTDANDLRVQRATLCVADIDRSLRLYRDILGFTVDFVKDSDADSYSYPVFSIPREAKIRFCVLSANTDQPRSLALTEITGTPLPRPPEPRLNALVLHVQDIDGALEKLAADGHTIYPEDKLVTQDGREGREIGFLDHDGHLIVIYRIDKHPA